MSEALSPDRGALDGTSGDSPGRHSPHLKTGSPQGLVGSNPTPSAFDYVSRAVLLALEWR